MKSTARSASGLLVTPIQHVATDLVHSVSRARRKGGAEVPGTSDFKAGN